MPSKEQVIKRTLKELGVKPGVNGYKYLVEAIVAVHDDESRLRGLVKGLYTDIAHKYNVSATSVERAIRCSIEVSYTQAPLEAVANVFGNTLPPYKDKPANKQYIATVADYVRDIVRYEEAM